jgi:hypothetical protein
LKRITLFTTVVGGLLMALGFLFVAASMSGTREQDARAMGMLIMAFGGMIVAVPMYVEARRLHSNELAKVLQKGKARAAQRCSGCGMETAAFWCTTHTLRLCADCVAKHDEPSRCLYKSLVSAAAAKAGR